MLETIKKYINELPEYDFHTYYQQYILNIQDENIGVEEINIGKILGKIHKEMGNLL